MYKKKKQKKLLNLGFQKRICPTENSWPNKLSDNIDYIYLLFHRRASILSIYIKTFSWQSNLSVWIH